MARFLWDLDSVKEEALKYDRRTVFLKGSNGAYEWARKNKVLDLCCSHMEGNQSHDLKSVKIAALKYSTRTQFVDGDYGAYQAALRNGWLDLVCGHMEERFVHTLKSVQATALKYQTRTAFFDGDASTYTTARRNGWLDLVCEHMETVLTYHTLESVKEVALKYSTRTRFLEGDYGAYKAALRNNWLDLCCGHMERGASGYDPTKPGTLYYIRIDPPNGIPLYKIGITNLKVKQRINGMGIPADTTVTILKTITNDDGAYIAMLEKKLHNHFRNFQYTGPNIMDNGNTELFTVDVRGWGVLN